MTYTRRLRAALAAQDRARRSLLREADRVRDACERLRLFGKAADAWWEADARYTGARADYLAALWVSERIWEGSTDFAAPSALARVEDDGAARTLR